MPPSGFVAGIYARNDIDRGGLQGAGQRGGQPGAIGFEQTAEQGAAGRAQPRGHQLLPLLRGPRHAAVGRAHRSARDPEWKYVNLRRYFAYLERSIDKGTQWAVFEPNGERALGQRAPHGRGLPAQRVAERRAARRQAREGVLRQVRPLDDDAERSRQRPAGLPGRRRAAAARRVRHLPHRPVDGRPQGLRSGAHGRAARSSVRPVQLPGRPRRPATPTAPRPASRR